MKKLVLAVLTCLFVFSFSASSFASMKALLVGIDDYQTLPAFSREEKCDLKGSVNDVIAIQTALISYYGFSKDDIRVLLNKEATRENIDRAFNQWLVNGTKPGDLAVFYFSGHGSSVLDYNGDEDDGYDEVLLPYDMVSKGGHNIIVDDEMGLWLDRLNGRTVSVIIDSCHSGGAVRGIGGKTVSSLEQSPAWRCRFIPITDYQPDSVTRGIPRSFDVPESVIFMAASRENEAALEVRMPQGTYGGFSFGLYDGMKRLRAPSYEKLFKNAKKMVKDRLKLPQEPQIVANKVMVVRPAFGISRPAPLHELANLPVALPETIGERVLVAVETFEGSSHQEMKELRGRLSKLPIVELAQQSQLFDRLIRGEKVNGAYQARLLNRIGDVERLEPAATVQQLVELLGGHLEYAYMVKQLARIQHPNPPFRVKVWVTDETRREFRLGESIIFGIESERDCYVVVVNLDSEGSFHVIFPNKYNQDNFVKANTPVQIPNEKMRAGGVEIEFGAPAGEETVKVIATTRPLDLDALWSGDFKGAFQTLSGEKRASFLGKVLSSLSSNRFDWSEDTVVVRSYE